MTESTEKKTELKKVGWFAAGIGLAVIGAICLKVGWDSWQSNGRGRVMEPLLTPSPALADTATPEASTATPRPTSTLPSVPALSEDSEQYQECSRHAIDFEFYNRSQERPVPKDGFRLDEASWRNWWQVEFENKKGTDDPLISIFENHDIKNYWQIQDFFHLRDSRGEIAASPGNYLVVYVTEVDYLPETLERMRDNYNQNEDFPAAIAGKLGVEYIENPDGTTSTRMNLGFYSGEGSAGATSVVFDPNVNQEVVRGHERIFPASHRLVIIVPTEVGENGTILLSGDALSEDPSKGVFMFMVDDYAIEGCDGSVNLIVPATIAPTPTPTLAPGTEQPPPPPPPETETPPEESPTPTPEIPPPTETPPPTFEPTPTPRPTSTPQGPESTDLPPTFTPMPNPENTVEPTATNQSTAIPSPTSLVPTVGPTPTDGPRPTNTAEGGEAVPPNL